MMLAEPTRWSHPHGKIPVPSSWQMTPKVRQFPVGSIWKLCSGRVGWSPPLRSGLRPLMGSGGGRPRHRR